MESFAPENAGLVSELLSRRSNESALDVESATLRESLLRAIESSAGGKESFCLWQGPGGWPDGVRRKLSHRGLFQTPVPPHILPEHCQSSQRGKSRHEDNIICMLLELQLFYKFAKDKYTTYFGFTSQFSCRTYGTVAFNGRIFRLCTKESVGFDTFVNRGHRPRSRWQGLRLHKPERKDNGEDLGAGHIQTTGRYDQGRLPGCEAS